MIRPALAALALSLGVLAPSAPSAQAPAAGLSAEEIRDRFEQQKTRSLAIAPVTGGGASAAEGAAVAPADYDQMPVDMQVNVAIVFDFDSAALREDQKARLAELCGVMREADVQLFRIVGHTDATGPVQYNERLSQLRAEEVKRYLVSDCGIAQSRLEAIGVGMRYLYDPSDPAGAANRRVEFQVVS